MSFLFPLQRVAFAPAHCRPARREVVPLFNLFDETFNEIQRASRVARRQFNPRFDLKETKEAYSLEGELPGVEQNNLNIEFTDEHTLTIKGRTERNTESGRRPEAVEAEKKAAIEETPAASETESEKAHHATVEDEEPANSSAAAAESSAAPTPAPAQQPAKTEAKTPEQQYWISERHVGEFTRSFNFPQRVDQESVKASLKNGILSVVVPKAPAPESRRINIE